MFSINYRTRIVVPEQEVTPARFGHIIRILQRDIRRAVGFKPILAKKWGDSNLVLAITPLDAGAESFELICEKAQVT